MIVDVALKLFTAAMLLAGVGALILLYLGGAYVMWFIFETLVRAVR